MSALVNQAAQYTFVNIILDAVVLHIKSIWYIWEYSSRLHGKCSSRQSTKWNAKNMCSVRWDNSGLKCMLQFNLCDHSSFKKKGDGQIENFNLYSNLTSVCIQRYWHTSFSAELKINIISHIWQSRTPVKTDFFIHKNCKESLSSIIKLLYW